MATEKKLSRREREIMDIIYSAQTATASEVKDKMSDPPSYSAVRATLRILEKKGHLRHEYDGPRYVFLPTETRVKASKTALKKLVSTFFDGSPKLAAAALLDMDSSDLTEEERASLQKMIDSAREEGR